MLYAKEEHLLCINQEYNLNIEIDIFLRMYRAHFPYLTLSEEVQSMLNSLVAENMIIGIITDGRERTQLNKIKALGLDKYISLANCVISESFGYSKPSQEAFLFFSISMAWLIITILETIPKKISSLPTH